MRGGQIRSGDSASRGKWHESMLMLPMIVAGLGLLLVLGQNSVRLAAQGESLDDQLAWAAATGSLADARAALEAGANPAPEERVSPLLLAEMRGSWDVAELLVERGALREPQQARLALGYAASQGNTKMIGLMLERGMDVNSKDHWGRTPLLRAARSADRACVEFLLRHGADPNAADREGHTPLIESARNSEDVAAALMAGGAQ